MNRREAIKSFVIYSVTSLLPNSFENTQKCMNDMITDFNTVIELFDNNERFF